MRFVLVSVLLFATVSPAAADVAVAKIFGDNMVLQRDMPVPVWGKAAPGEEVNVSILEQRKTTRGDAQGNWKVVLEEMKAGGPHTLTVAGKNTVSFKNVLVGEVWLCSGQSNMAWIMAQLDKEGAKTADANFPMLRLNTAGGWQECTPATAHKFSATAYYFGANLQQALKMPVGLINRSVGGTSARLWTSKEAIESSLEMKPFAENLFKDPKSKDSIGRLYEANIRPLIPYAIRGTIWYQGESDANSPDEYAQLFPTMIRSWRNDWKQGDFPFLFVLLGAIGPASKDPSQVGWGPIREAQLAALKLPRTAVAAYHDSHADIHPINKELIGVRLALAARNLVYGDKIVASGPTFESLRIEGDKAVVSFGNVGGGLTPKGDKLQGFAVAGEDGKFVWAEASIEGNKVLVWNANIQRPVAVRYAFTSNPLGTLYNREGLPALPFRTDGRK